MLNLSGSQGSPAVTRRRGSWTVPEILSSSCPQCFSGSRGGWSARIWPSTLLSLCMSPRQGVPPSRWINSICERSMKHGKGFDSHEFVTRKSMSFAVVGNTRTLLSQGEQDLHSLQRWFTSLCKRVADDLLPGVRTCPSPMQ